MDYSNRRTTQEMDEDSTEGHIFNFGNKAATHTAVFGGTNNMITGGSGTARTIWPIVDKMVEMPILSPIKNVQKAQNGPNLMVLKFPRQQSDHQVPKSFLISILLKTQPCFRCVQHLLLALEMNS